jgi:hypothetical protein
MLGHIRESKTRGVHFLLKPLVVSFKNALFAAAILLIQGHADPGSEGPFLGLSGHWSGAGTVTMTNGATERIRCKAAYAVNTTGKAVQQTLRCASDSYKFEITSNVIFEGGSLSGSWAEATRGMSGSVSGRASGAGIVANVARAAPETRLWQRGACKRKRGCGEAGSCGWMRSIYEMVG